MCYGSNCNYEGYMGECSIYDFSKIRKLTEYNSCFIGGMCICEEEQELYNELLAEGKINKMREIIIKNKLAKNY